MCAGYDAESLVVSDGIFCNKNLMFTKGVYISSLVSYLWIFANKIRTMACMLIVNEYAQIIVVLTAC